jgi:hypothetical protein
MNLLLEIFFYGVYAFSGGVVGNGGGFALCRSENNIQYFSYDLLLNIKNEPTTQELTKTYNTDLTWQESLNWISDRLEKLDKPMADNFKNFVSSIYTSQAKSQYHWIEAQDLPLMWEPELEDLLPNSCKTRKQAIYYFEPDEKNPYSTYNYDAQFITRVLSQPQGQLQISFLMVHEWLWSYYSRAKYLDLARMNRLLHSKNNMHN